MLAKMLLPFLQISQKYHPMHLHCNLESITLCLPEIVVHYYIPKTAILVGITIEVFVYTQSVAHKGSQGRI